MKTMLSNHTTVLRLCLAMGLSATAAVGQVTAPSPDVEQRSVAVDQLKVPADGEWSDTFEGTYLRVGVVSRPYFGADAAKTPALEVGGAGIAFVRDEFGGSLVLLGEKQTTLPYVIALGEDGRSRATLNLIVTYDASLGEATVRVGNAVHRFLAPEGKGSQPVVLSAGRSEAWDVARLKIDTTKTDAVTKVAESSEVLPGQDLAQVRRPSRAEKQAETARRKQAYEGSRQLFLAKDRVRAERMLLAENRHEPGTAAWYREAATRLTHAALALRQRYDIQGAIEVGRRAQTFLKEAATLASADLPKDRAQIHELSGFLWEELLRDAPAAATEYETALGIYDKSPRALEAKARIAERAALRAAAENAQR